MHHPLNAKAIFGKLFFLSVLLAALFVAYSGTQTVKALKENMHRMVCENADYRSVFDILSKFFKGKAENGDGEKLCRAVFGLSEAENLTVRDTHLTGFFLCRSIPLS